MQRREFIKWMGVLGGGAYLTRLGGLASPDVYAAAAETYEKIVESDNVLVLINLSGGNDGLNTVIPLDQYDNLAAARPSIVIPKNRVLALNTKTGLHPSLVNFKSLYDESKLTIVQSVGYETPNMSHFRSSDVIWTGGNYDDFLSTGWQGRYLDKNFLGFPSGYPSAENPDPIMLTMTSGAATIGQGAGGSFSVVSTNPSSKVTFEDNLYSGYSLSGDGRYENELEFVRSSQGQTKSYTQAVYDTYQKGPEITTISVDAGNLEKDLLAITTLLGGGIKTKVFLLQLGGFDTHGGQVTEGDSTQGKHADLLSELDTAVGSFMASLSDNGLDDRVTGLVFSEFGRRIISNESYGSDHGHAAPWFLFGNKVSGTILGESPVIPNPATKQDNVPFQFDFKNVYKGIFEDWFGLDESTSESLFDFTPAKVSLFKEPYVTPINAAMLSASVGMAYPNPVYTQTSIPIELSANSRVALQLVSSKGEVLQSHQYTLGVSDTVLNLERQGEASGKYYLRVSVNGEVETQTLEFR
ncbi:DUF1501 domain-containing protein [bacterium]|nr:DUF1501 domain-containing protein [bacterium]